MSNFEIFRRMRFHEDHHEISFFGKTLWRILEENILIKNFIVSISNLPTIFLKTFKKSFWDLMKISKRQVFVKKVYLLKYEGLPRGLEIFRRGLTRMKMKSRGFLFLGKNKLEVLKSRDLFFRLEISKPRVFFCEEIDPRDTISSPRFARGFKTSVKKFSSIQKRDRVISR